MFYELIAAVSLLPAELLQCLRLHFQPCTWATVFRDRRTAFNQLRQVQICVIEFNLLCFG